MINTRVCVYLFAVIFAWLASFAVVFAKAGR
jgi:hypothetical protein